MARIRDKIGTVDCPFCGMKACRVSSNVKGNLYYLCNKSDDSKKDCGIVQPNLAGFQKFMRDHATITDKNHPDYLRHVDANEWLYYDQQKPTAKKVASKKTEPKKPAEKETEQPEEKQTGAGFF